MERQENAQVGKSEGFESGRAILGCGGENTRDQGTTTQMSEATPCSDKRNDRGSNLSSHRRLPRHDSKIAHGGKRAGVTEQTSTDDGSVKCQGSMCCGSGRTARDRATSSSTGLDLLCRAKQEQARQLNPKSIHTCLVCSYAPDVTPCSSLGTDPRDSIKVGAVYTRHRVGKTLLSSHPRPIRNKTSTCTRNAAVPR